MAIEYSSLFISKSTKHDLKHCTYIKQLLVLLLWFCMQYIIAYFLTPVSSKHLHMCTVHLHIVHCLAFAYVYTA